MNRNPSKGLTIPKRSPGRGWRVKQSQDVSYSSHPSGGYGRSNCENEPRDACKYSGNQRKTIRKYLVKILPSRNGNVFSNATKLLTTAALGILHRSTEHKRRHWGGRPQWNQNFELIYGGQAMYVGLLVPWPPENKVRKSCRGRFQWWWDFALKKSRLLGFCKKNNRIDQRASPISRLYPQS